MLQKPFFRLGISVAIADEDPGLGHSPEFYHRF
jgi:hypothetical protein